jgi:hypothetical protein
MREEHQLLEEPPEQRKQISELVKFKHLKSHGTMERQLGELSVLIRHERELAVKQADYAATPAAGPVEQRATLAGRIKAKIDEIIAIVLAFFGAKQKKRRRLTKGGEAALRQLKTMAALCRTCHELSPDETILFETEFGRAYYEIMSFSSKAANSRMADDAQDAAYLRTISSFVASVG